jgi:tetratricopeptide (TPR) repeat protein
VTTSSLEAYNYFLKGKEDYLRFYYESALQFLKQAIELDPNFAVAHMYLAFLYNGLGNTKARNEAYKKAKTFSENATDKERLYIEAFYTRNIEGQSEKYFRILKKITEKYPKEKLVHYLLARYYRAESLTEMEIEELNRSLELDPNYGEALNMLGYTYASLEDYEKAIECLKKYGSLFPQDANPLDSLAEIYFKMGRLDKAMAKYKEALIVKPDFYNTHWKIGYIYALKENYPQAMNWINQYISIAPTLIEKADGGYIWKGFYYAWMGRLDQALTELKRAVKIWKDVENKDRESLTERTIGWIYYDRGELESCRNYFKRGIDIIIKNRPERESLYTIYNSFYLGLIELKEGRIDSAKSRLSEMKSLLPKINSDNKHAPFYYDLLNGEVLLEEGSVDEAIAVCKNARTLGTPDLFYSIRTLMYSIPFLNDVLARAYQQNGELDKAIVEYERLITFDSNSKERRLIHPKLHYRLAKLYEEKSFKGKAIKHYEKFLDLWKDADPGIDEVEDAKKRLAGLRDQQPPHRFSLTGPTIP